MWFFHQKGLITFIEILKDPFHSFTKIDENA